MTRKEELLLELDQISKEKKDIAKTINIESPKNNREKYLDNRSGEIGSELRQITVDARKEKEFKKEEGKPTITTSLDRFVLTKNINEYLTPEYIADIMVDLAIKHGYKGGEVLEPSMGHGVFFIARVGNRTKVWEHFLEQPKASRDLRWVHFPALNHMGY